MDILSNELLIQAYERAIKEGLSSDFVDLLFQEISKRNLKNQLSKPPVQK
ncbi:sporulation histidine kinase inhibitor Sda [Bacillus suaedae]|uniref:Sporulation histidine kinase inhibitor Sda n=1 Tax=Halalkalibacter suaedae TaxID=2822140 RepID=A0A940WXA6_9BACI|nr:sporulation histidine kinase inhibitor Sda [Bacillus suaedae]MBP3952352.1 sporulation histidine kinase inhibitor Sda [Bacillus suaedae]